MARFTILIGALLILLGILGYIGAGAWIGLGAEGQSITALIPAVFGGLLVILGAAALVTGRRALMMHIAAALGLLGILGTARALLKLPALIEDPGQLERPTAILAQSIMTALCLVFLIACILSFVRARRGAGGKG